MRSTGWWIPVCAASIFIAVNTDKQALALSRAETKIKIGEKVPRVGRGRQAADRPAGRGGVPRGDLPRRFKGADLVFVTCGMGGGTGTGAAPVIAEIARTWAFSPIGVVSKPFLFEGRQRMKNAEAGIEQLKLNVDTLVVVPMTASAGGHQGHHDDRCLRIADDTLRQGIQGISDDRRAVTDQSGLCDVRSVMESRGLAHMASASARAKTAWWTPPRRPSRARCWKRPSTAPARCLSTSTGGPSTFDHRHQRGRAADYPGGGSGGQHHLWRGHRRLAG